MIAPMLLSLSTLVPANPTPLEILTRMEDAISRAKDQVLEYDMIDLQPGKDERHLAIEISMKGPMRLSSFTAPADVRGTRVLILGDDRMYVYLPAYKKVRRIASHVTEQGFLGTTFSNDDLALTKYSDKYDAKLLEEDEKLWHLEATQKASATAPYRRIEMAIQKADFLPVEFKYFSEKGTHLKTETRGEYTCEKEVCAPALLTMTDHTENGHLTKLVRKKWKVNSGLDDDVFSVRNLQRN